MLYVNVIVCNCFMD